MLAREEDVEAGALRAQGWSISAIARQLGRNRETVRSYLNGERTPGVRRRSGENPFDRFEPYVSQRLQDDPHLQLSTLLREVQQLGFAGSYQTFTRQVRSRALRPRCEACAGAKGRATIEIEHPPRRGDPARLAGAARGAVGRDGAPAGRSAGALGEVPGVVLRGQGHAPPDRRHGRGLPAPGRG